MTARTWVAVVAAVVFLAAGGGLLGGLLAMPDTGMWAATVVSELSGSLRGDAAPSVDALYRQVVGGAVAGAAVGAAAGLGCAVLLRRVARRAARPGPA